MYFKKFEALYYTEPELDNYMAIEFSTKQALFNFYKKHKDDKDKFGWWLTKRNYDWEVVEEYETSNIN